MAHIDVADAQSWLETTKLSISALDTDLEAEVVSKVLGRLAIVYDTSTWIDEDSTPALVKTAIAMLYSGWFYDRQYSESSDTNQYALRLKADAMTILDGLVEGSLTLPDQPPTTSDDRNRPAFFPTDFSSRQDPVEGARDETASWGGPSFNIGKVW